MDRKRYEAAGEFHGHLGPGLAIGYRVCEEALKRFNLSWDEVGAISAITETATCPADAIQHLFGATFGKGRLVYFPTGKQAFSFYNRDSGESFRAMFIARKPKGFTRDEWEQRILTAPFEELYIVQEPARVEFKEEPRYFPDETCVECGEGMSPYRSFKNSDGKLYCYECAIKANLIKDNVRGD